VGEQRTGLLVQAAAHLLGHGEHELGVVEVAALCPGRGMGEEVALAAPAVGVERAREKRRSRRRRA
jgi:hypothetical protein